jgi:glutaminyl-tRNA synthetase
MSDNASPSKAGSNEDEDNYTSAALNARELEWATNSADLVAAHKAFNTVDGVTVIRTRFPPEPNGYLHIGHAKSMNMNFRLAFDKLNVPAAKRRTIFRYDDTNPDAESVEYIDSLARDVAWLGWQPERTTYSSEYFANLHELAIKLIHQGLAYVCDMTKAEMEQQRDLAMKRVNARNSGLDPDVVAPISSSDILPGRNRNTSVERNLLLFQQMKMGCFAEGQYTLRLKMDWESSNPNMYDLVAYRIKYTPHPHLQGQADQAQWCIYPSYDFTHGICDSLEHIDYSICTLEFETRREPYYWILQALDLYRPAVYEMSRLNLQYTVLSKRKLNLLVARHHVHGWNDPRMPTISGLRRRGYTAAILNQFCQDVGATRKMNLVEMSKLYQTARLLVAPTARRCMACLEPVTVYITNFASELAKQGADYSTTYEVQNSPTDTSLGVHSITLSDTIYINQSDFRVVDSPEYFGLAPNKAVGLKYVGGNIICDKYLFSDENVVTELHCHLDLSESRAKPKTFISWVPRNTAIACEIRIYDHLFVVPEPSDLWESELNPDSEVIYKQAVIDPSILDVVDDVHSISPWRSTSMFQLERMGYFVVDNVDTTFDKKTGRGLLVLNRTVSLKEDVTIQKRTVEADELARIKRQELTKQQAAQRDSRMLIDPVHLFQQAPEYAGLYSQFHAITGIPTHDADGVELTKSAVKKLAKEQEKHAKKVAAYRKQQEQQ